MKVIVAGGGAIGLLIGSFLAEAGCNVIFYVRREEQAAALRSSGLTRQTREGSRVHHLVKATADASGLPSKALVIAAMKYAGIEALLTEFQGKGHPVLFVQNGLAHFEKAKKADLPALAFGTVEHGARRTDDITVMHNGIGRMLIAVEAGDPDSFKWLEDMTLADFPIAFRPNAEQLLLEKVMINCMINPLTALLQVENGELLRNAHAKKLFEELYGELAAAFPEVADHISYGRIAEVAEKTAANHSSMLVDRMEGNPMEIETIVTSVRQRAEAKGKNVRLLSILESLLLAIDRKGIES